MGVMPDRDLLRGLFGPLHRLIETIAWQQGWIMPWENLVTGTTDPGTYNMWMYSIHRRIDELEAEGTITHEEALNAFDNPENETFQQAFQEVVQRESIKSYVSLAAPTPLKYATPGEVEIREQLAEREATAEFYRPQYNETHPALRNYSRLFLTPEERQTDIERERLFTELGALGRDEEALARRTEIFAALEETTPPKYMWSRPGYLAASLGSMQPESEGDVLRWLNALEPTANEFKDEEGEIDWDAYDRAIETFRNRIIPDLSERWGFPVTEERFDQAEARYKTGIEVAFELNQERVSEGFRRLEMLQPGGTDFPAAARQFISAQYEADILAGMDPEVAAARGVDTFEYISVNGLPFEIEQEILGKYIRELPAEAFATQVLQRIGIDIGQNPETLMGMRTSLAQTGEQMRGMFTPQNEGDRARDELSTYYYSLSPGGRNALRDMLNIPEDIETFGRWVQDMSDEDVVAVAKTATALLPRAQSAVMDIHSSLTRLFGVPVETLIPLLSPLTAGERVQLEQAERDMFEYNYSQEYLDTPGEWTSLMDKYFGDPTSPKNEFWEELGRYALSTNAFDDPVLGAFLNAAVREGLDFSEAQYKWALDWFRQNRNLYIDPELTADIRDHPEWVRLGDTSRQYLRGMQSLRMEERKRVYFLIPDRRPSRGVPSPREEWERDHAEEYRQIVRYMNEQEARRVGEPHYLYFFYPRDYKRWFGERDPDEVEASGAADRISELWLQALEDMDAWREGSGEWTYAMEVLIGPNPGDVEGGSSGGGGGGGSSGGGEPPGPPGIPTPGPFPSP
jgi:hypothetical protein